MDWLEVGDDDYPTDETLELVEQWPPLYAERLFDELVRVWPSYGRAEKKGELYEFATGGWSGCEELLGALHRNKGMIWMITWQMSRRGGLHQFEVPECFRRGTIPA